MAIPFIIGAAAVAAGAFGVKKGLDAKSDLEDAERYARWAKEESEEANSNLDYQKNRTNDELESYGQSKKDAMEQLAIFDSLICYPDGTRRGNQLQAGKKFSETYPKIIITHEEEVNILKALHIIDENSSVNAATELVKAQNIEMETISSAVKAVASGSLAGLAAAGGAYAGVMYLGTASTTTAIATLSGAAAKSATLAWLGGGSLASGGLGVAGGTAVLGGLVAGPLLAIGGAVMASKAAEKKDEAYSEYQKVQAAVEKLEVVTSKLESIERYTRECYRTLQDLVFSWTLTPLYELKGYAERNVTLKDLSEEERGVVYANYAFYYTIADFIKQPTMNETGDDALEKKYRLAETKMKERTNYLLSYI